MPSVRDAVPRERRSVTSVGPSAAHSQCGRVATRITPRTRSDDCTTRPMVDPIRPMPLGRIVTHTIIGAVSKGRHSEGGGVAQGPDAESLPSGDGWGFSVPAARVPPIPDRIRSSCRAGSLCRSGPSITGTTMNLRRPLTQASGLPSRRQGDGTTVTRTNSQGIPRAGHRRSPHAAPGPIQSCLSSLFSSKSILLLLVGVLLGYMAVPIMLVELDPDHALSLLPPSPPQLRVADGASQPAPSRNLDVEMPVLRAHPSDWSAAELRLVEDRHVLARQSLPTPTTPYVMKTRLLPDHQRLKILVTGGAGFVGSHLVDKLMMEGHEVTVVDNFFTGQKKNIAHWLHHPNFR